MMARRVFVYGGEEKESVEKEMCLANLGGSHDSFPSPRRASPFRGWSVVSRFPKLKTASVTFYTRPDRTTLDHATWTRTPRGFFWSVLFIFISSNNQNSFGARFMPFM